MRTIKLFIEYEGTAFCGWQVQKKGRTVQEDLEKALGSVLQETVRLTGAGRTDAGVHAVGQVAHFKTGSRLSLNAMVKGSNTGLKDDVRVLRAVEAPPGFHARYSARSKIYRYTVLTEPSVLKRRTGWLVKYPLDLNLMKKGARKLKGTHDFRSCCVRKSEKPHYTCTITDIRWLTGKGELVLRIEGDRFLHNMVRIITGTLVDIGRGKIPLADLGKILKGRNRALAGRTAPPEGLCLVKIKYR